jgi:hypothetical protein
MGGDSPRDLRFSFVGKRRRRLGEESLRKLLSWDFDKIVIAHGDLTIDNARQLVELVSVAIAVIGRPPCSRGSFPPRARWV